MPQHSDPLDDPDDDWFDWATMRPYDKPSKIKPNPYALQWAARKTETKLEVQRDTQGRALERAIDRAKTGKIKPTFQARVRHQGTQVYLGSYRTKEEADEAVFRFRIGITP